MWRWLCSRSMVPRPGRREEGDRKAHIRPALDTIISIPEHPMPLMVDQRVEDVDNAGRRRRERLSGHHWVVCRSYQLENFEEAIVDDVLRVLGCTIIGDGGSVEGSSSRMEQQRGSLFPDRGLCDCSIQTNPVLNRTTSPSALFSKLSNVARCPSRHP